jgi:triosephosphate isomerase
MRRKLIAGAQKQYLNLRQSIAFAHKLVEAIQNKKYSFDIAICPSFISLAHVSEILAGSEVGLGAQNVHERDSGAFTGQISLQHLLDIDVRYVIVGHSELREHQSETSLQIKEKVKICLNPPSPRIVMPIVCVGEKVRGEDAEQLISNDLRTIFGEVTPARFQVENVVVAYEPVWAIKAGKDDKDTQPADPDYANKMHSFIRATLAEIYDSELAQRIRILYGGSVNETNAIDYLKQPEIDGLLIGSASVRIESFLQILDSAQKITVGLNK